MNPLQAISLLKVKMTNGKEDHGGQFTTTEPPQFEQERASIVEKLLEYNKLLEHIRYFLLGYYVLDGEVKQDETLRLLNEKGCRAILFEVSQRISPQVVLGAITEEEAKDRARRFEIALSQKFVDNYEDWQIKNISALDIVVDTLGDLIFVAMTRPIKGTAFGGIIDISQLREHTIQRDSYQPKEKKEGLFSKLRGNKEEA